MELRHDGESDAASTSETIRIASRLSHLPLEVIRSLFDPQQNTLDLTVKTPFEPGQEVYNTYGEGMGWAKQACEWGFIDGSIEGDGALGKGLKWELSDVLSRDSENYESAKKAWKTLCGATLDLEDKETPTNSSKEGVIDDEHAGSDSLFFSPPLNEAAKDTLLLNEDGQISYPLFWALICALHPASEDKSETAKKLDALARMLQQSEVDVEAPHFNDGSTRAEHSTDMRSVVRFVISLFERRVTRTSHAGQSSAELCDMLDKVSLSPSTTRVPKLILVSSENSALRNRSLPHSYGPQDIDCGKKCVRGRNCSMGGDIRSITGGLLMRG